MPWFFSPRQIRYDDEDEDEGPQPDPTLEQGVPIPVRMQGNFPAELAATPLEDIDTFYTHARVMSMAHSCGHIKLISHFAFADLRSCKQRQRYFSFLCNRRIMAAWSVQSNSSRSYLYSGSSIIFVVHHHDYPHQLYINDNAVVTNRRVNRVSTRRRTVT